MEIELGNLRAVQEALKAIDRVRYTCSLDVVYRVHRLVVTHQVKVIKEYTGNKIDERVIVLQRRKQQIVASVSEGL